MEHAVTMAKSPAIGIDLGTSNSCVAVFRHGKVEIIPNDLGIRTTPSYVAFNDSERLIGDPAFIQLIKNLENTVFDAKRLIGRKFDDECVQKDMENWPFDVINDSGRPKIRIQYKGETKDFYPEVISSMVLEKMKESAESYLGQEVENAVITVPAYFNDLQRHETEEAGKIAGLNVLSIINEPTAAAITYGFNTEPGEKNVLIFDFGGGTFDVSVVNIKNKEIVVKSTGGDTHLGGEDIDNILVRHFAEEFKQNYKKDITNNKKSLRKLRFCVEKTKRTLVGCSKALVEVDSLYGGIDFSSSISRALFDMLCHDLFQQTLIHVEKALNDAKMDKSQINEVVLVGGSSRIPKVQKMLQEFFVGTKLNKSVNLDEAVAYGAAIHAAKINGDKTDILNRFSIIDVTPLSLGINGHNEVVDKIIQRNSPIPAYGVSIRTTEDDYQTTAYFQVCEGERPMVNDNNILGQLIVTGIPAKPKGEVIFEVAFSIDCNGILTVTVLNKETGIVDDIKVINERGRLSSEQINRMIDDAAKFRQQDKKEKERRNTIHQLEEYCYETRKKMEAPVSIGKIPSLYRKLVIDACGDAIKWIGQNKEMAEKEDIEEKKRDLIDTCQPTLQMIS